MQNRAIIAVQNCLIHVRRPREPVAPLLVLKLPAVVCLSVDWREFLDTSGHAVRRLDDRR